VSLSGYILDLPFRLSNKMFSFALDQMPCMFSACNVSL
jgi:hypothetical protein